MKKNIRYIMVCMMCFVASLLHKPVYAAEPDIDTGQQNSFFSKNNSLPLHWGIKSFAQVTYGRMKEYNSVGMEAAVGPFLEWHFLNGIGIQTGILASFNRTLALGSELNGQKLSMHILDIPEIIETFKTAAQSDNVQKNQFKIDAIANQFSYWTLSIPLTLRIYLGQTKRWVFYGGTRFVFSPFWKEKKTFFNIALDGSKFAEHTAKRFIDSRDLGQSLQAGIDSIIGSSSSISRKEDIYNWLWDYGIEFNAHSGFVIGIKNGLGIVVGYDFMKCIA